MQLRWGLEVGGGREAQWFEPGSEEGGLSLLFCFLSYSRFPHPHHYPSPVCSPKREVDGLGHEVLLGGLLDPWEFLKDPVLLLFVSAPSLYPALCSVGIRTPALYLAI